MCAPAVALVAAGAAVQMAAQYRKGKFDAKIAENNAELARQQRNDVITRGAEEARGVEIEGRRTAAAAKTAVAASGVSGGSMDDLVALSSANAAVDAATVRSNAVRAAWGFKAEEQEHKARARESREAGLLGALGTGLSGGGQAASTYASAKAKD